MGRPPSSNPLIHEGEVVAIDRCFFTAYGRQRPQRQRQRRICPPPSRIRRRGAPPPPHCQLAPTSAESNTPKFTSGSQCSLPWRGAAPRQRRQP